MRTRPLLCAGLAGLVFSCTLALAQESAPAKRPVTPADYGKWERVRGGTLSPDGSWLAWQISRENDEDELRLRMLATDSVEVFEYGSRAEFSEDGRWLGFLIGVSEKEREKLEKAKKPVRTKLGLHDLKSGETAEVEGVAGFTFDDSGAYVALRRYPAEGAEGGADLVVRELASGLDTTFGNVGEHAWCEDATLLAMVIDAAEGPGNGVQVYDAASGLLRTLDSSEHEYVGLTWRDDASDLAVLRELEYDEDEDEDVAHVVLAWSGLGTDAPERRTLDPRSFEGFPDLRITDFAGLRWSDDGAALFFGLKEWERRPEWARPAEKQDAQETKDAPSAAQPESAPAPGAQKVSGPATAEGAAGEAEEKAEAKEKDADEEKEAEPPKSLRESLDEPSNVEVWHSKDVDIIPLQKRQARRDERESWLAAWWLADGALVRLGDELTEDVELLEGQRRALGLDNTPYEELKRFGPTLEDVYVIDARSGEKRKVLSGVKYTLGSSPDGRWFAYVADDHVWVHDVEGGTSRNLTAAVDVPFIDQENSSLTDQKPPYGVAGWCKRSDELFLYDRYDLWMFPLDGTTPTRLTHGREEQVRQRVLELERDFDERDEGLDLSGTTWLSLYGERTKKTGFARIVGGRRPERLLWKDAGLSSLAKADEAEVYAFLEQRFDDSPDLFVAGADLAKPRQVTATNPFQDEYLWGRAELIDYASRGGEELQGALFYPAGYEPGKKYPLIVYIYERLSQTLHSYDGPSEKNPYGTAAFTAEGYFVLRPDIVYRAQNPGLSAVECVVPAVEKVLERGMVDPERVGIVGHSWGAYQTAFLVTHTDTFAAGVAGAPLTNMMSMSMSIYWNSGQTDAWIFHESQGRMDRPFWEDVPTYIANSPIFGIEDMRAPLLIAFGDEDGAVDWNQGVEMYNAARLAGKELVMLVYPGENHGLREEPNQVDYHYRVLAWFDHYLKGAEAEPWIHEGKPHLERQKELEELERKNGKKGGGPGGGPGPGPRRGR